MTDADRRRMAEVIERDLIGFQEGKPAVRAFDLMVANNRNMPLMQPTATPPSAKDAGDAEALDGLPPGRAFVWERAGDDVPQGCGRVNADDGESGGLT